MALFVVLLVLLTINLVIPLRVLGCVCPDLPRIEFGKHATGAMRDDALIATVQRDDTIYFRSDKLNPSDLPTEIRSAMSQAVERRLYIRADRRARYSSVKYVLNAARGADIQNVTFIVEPTRSLTR
jgi:biopolymer transport protein ExbD/biopolymer transport protein TolR